MEFNEVGDVTKGGRRANGNQMDDKEFRQPRQEYHKPFVIYEVSQFNLSLLGIYAIRS